MHLTSYGTLVILITSTGELLLYFIVIFFSFHKKKLKISAAGIHSQWISNLEGRLLKVNLPQELELNQMEHLEGEQYSQYPMEGNSRRYMSMRDYRNLPWQWQQPVVRNPNPPKSMREYRDQWRSVPSYMAPPQYTSTPQPP